MTIITRMLGFSPFEYVDYLFTVCICICVRAHACICENVPKHIFRIMVLDNGVLKEMGTPRQLMDDPTTIFYKMAKNAGLIRSAFHRQ